MKLSIPDMSCGHCRAAIKAAVAVVDPEAKIEFDAEERTADLTTEAEAAAILAALEAEGYPASLSV